MTKEQKGILIKSILWVITLIIVCIVGITNIFALTNNSNLRFYDNNGSSLTYVTTEYTANTGESTAIFTTTANSYGGAVMIQANTPLIQNHIYTIFLNVGAYNYGGQTQESTKNCVGIGTTYNTAISNYINCNITPRFTQSSGVTLDKERGLYFTFIANANATYILLPYTTANTCNNCMQYSFGYNIEDAGDSTNLSQSQVNNIINNQTTNINNSITQSQNAITNNSNANRDTIINNQNTNKQAIIDNQNANNETLIDSNTQNTQDIIDNQNANNQKILDDNKKNFNDCHDSVNIANITSITSRGYTATLNDDVTTINGTSSTFGDVKLYTNNSNLILQANKTYTISLTTTGTINGSGYKVLYLILNGSWKQIGSLSNNFKYTYTPTQNETLSQIILDLNKDLTFNNYTIKVQIQEGSTATDYEKYGEEICVNKLDEANKTSKGILGKLGDLLSYINPFSENFFVYKLIELLGDLLKDLFVPSSTFIKNWYDDFKSWFEAKLGFLATPFTLFIDFIETFLNLEESNLIINIPRITVPNFEENVLVEARTFNWGELLNSKQEFKTLWELYLDFIDVFLILNFLGLCETKYNRIFGGDTTPYEYYTTEETYNINDETGEATNHMLRQRTTRREKVK